MSPAADSRASRSFADPDQEDLVAHACHKLRTPLTAAMGFLQLALRDAQRSGLDTPHLTMVDQQLRRMAGLLDDLAAKSSTQ